jgi:hypothetical protein
MDNRIRSYCVTHASTREYPREWTHDHLHISRQKVNSFPIDITKLHSITAIRGVGDELTVSRDRGDLEPNSREVIQVI